MLRPGRGMRNSNRKVVGVGIRQDFDRIKRLFFPRWDREGLWRVTTNASRQVHGRCDPERKRIEIILLNTDPDKHDALIIHELCHAVTNGGHEKTWQARMEAAAKRADRIERPKLAKLLRGEIVAYQKAPRSIDIVYGDIEDAMHENPNLTFTQIKRWIARDHGLLPVEVCKYFKRAEAVYNKAKRQGKEFRAIDEALRKRMGDAAQQ